MMPIPLANRYAVAKHELRLLLTPSQHSVQPCRFRMPSEVVMQNWDFGLFTVWSHSEAEIA